MSELDAAPSAGLALGLLDRKPVLAEIEVFPTQALDLPPAQTRIERDCVRHGVVGAQCGEQPLNQQLRDFPTFARSFGRRLPRAIGAFGSAEKRRPDEDHWFLDIIGVRPDRQGQGVGSALLRAALTQIDEAGLPAFLVTSNPSNVPFYEKLAFHVGEEYDIGPVHVWPMLRRPKAISP